MYSLKTFKIRSFVLSLNLKEDSTLKEIIIVIVIVRPSNV